MKAIKGVTNLELIRENFTFLLKVFSLLLTAQIAVCKHYFGTDSVTNNLCESYVHLFSNYNKSTISNAPQSATTRTTTNQMEVE